MIADAETGVVNQLAVVAELAHANGSLLHCDGTYFVGQTGMRAPDAGGNLVLVVGALRWRRKPAV